MQQVKGSHLAPQEQQRALSQFVHRYTGDHKPEWAHKPWKDGQPYPLQFLNDQEWLAHTLFYVTKAGKISERHKYCESRPTWPNNPELRK